MDRRRFLESAAAASVTAYLPPSAGSPPVQPIDILKDLSSSLIPNSEVDVAGHTLICEFTLGGTDWKVYEDLRTRDGGISFVCSGGARILSKSAEASFAEAQSPYLGLSLKDIGMSPRDLLADRLLEGGEDPDPARVRSAAPPLGSTESKGPSWRLPWDTSAPENASTRCRCFPAEARQPIIPSNTSRKPRRR